MERRSPRWDDDLESARTSLSAAVSLVLRLVGRDADPARSREHVLLSVLAERRLRAGESADLPSPEQVKACEPGPWATVAQLARELEARRKPE